MRLRPTSPRASIARRCARAAGLLALLLVTARAAFADVLLLDDGRRVEGKIVEETATEVKIKTNFGTLTFKKSEIEKITREKTRDEIYDERLAACKTAQDFYELGLWCEENKLRRRAEGLYEKAIGVDPDHAPSRGKLGFVKYKGEWMTPAERDERAAADFAKEMLEQGLVEHEGEWVTPDEKAKLERGLMNLDGRWVTREEYMKRKGLGEWNGEKMPLEKALAHAAADGFSEGAEGEVNYHVGAQGVVIGMLPDADLEAIALGLDKTRAWFDEAFGNKAGLKMFGGRLPELYVFGEGEDRHYPHAIEWTSGRSNYVPEGWDKAVSATLGYTWVDPIALSAARQGPRGVQDLYGHCYHNMGHMLVGRLLYDGRMLPPWYEEGVAALAEMRTHGVNKVFCRSSVYAYEGSQSDTKRPDFDDAVMRDGSWRHALKGALERGETRPFDKLAQLPFSQMTTLDIAQSMAIVEWLESQPGALVKFHRSLRRSAPQPPARLYLDGNERQRANDNAFQAAVGMGFRQADAEWKQWFRSL